MTSIIQFKCQYCIGRVKNVDDNIESKSLTKMSRDNRSENDDVTGGVLLEKKEKTEKPSLYRVLMLNDDYTPMEFVVLVLQRFFGHNNEAAQQIMLHVHQRGVGICGVYTFEIAEAKASQVMNFARQNEHPLQLQLEKE
tara:strand:+ start:141 stop:557 length:417 start_codon:yes stop_codon:yes gene_type:complete